MHQVSEQQMQARIGTTMGGGKYRLTELLGAGAMGAVFRARHVELDRDVAVKVLHEWVTSVPEAAARFRREAKAASRLRHRHSIQILDVGEDDGECFIVMEYLDGRQLFDVVADAGRLPPHRAVSLMSQILGALGAAHDVGVVHRDIKAENVVVVDGVNDDGNPVEHVKVLDFGIAKLLTREAGSQVKALTQAGQVAGTPAYMSPEQATGISTDARSDIYSCGVLLYFMLTGALPYDSETDMGLMLQHVTAPIPHPRTLNPRLSERLSDIVMACMAKDPEERPATARELRKLLKAAVGSMSATTDREAAAVPLPVSPVSEDTRDSEPGLTEMVSKRPWPVVAAAAVFACLGGVGAWIVLSGGEPDTSVGDVATNTVGAAAVSDSAGAMETVPTVHDPGPQELGADKVAVAASGGRDANAAAVLQAVGADASASIDRDVLAETSALSPDADDVSAAADLSGEARDASGDDSPPPPAPAVAEVDEDKNAPTRGAEKKRDTQRRAKSRKSVAAKKTTAATPEAPVVKAVKPQPAAVVTVVPPLPKTVLPAPKVLTPPKPGPSVVPKAVTAKPVAPAPKMMSASVAVKGLSAQGSLSSGTVRRAVEARKGRYSECFSTAASAAGGGKKTTLKVALTIDEDGFARGVSVKGGGFGTLKSCVKGVLARVRSHKRPDTGVVRTTFSLSFH